MSSPETGGKGPTDQSNRRRHDRVEAKLSLATVLEGREVQIEAANISEGGAYCLSDSVFPIMTRLGVSLALPPTNGSIDPNSLDLEAVVVRCDPHPIREGRFSLALFFPRIEDDARARIAAFVKCRRDAEARLLSAPAPSDG